MQFCRTVLSLIIVILIIFVGYLSDRFRLKYFIRLNEILLVMSARPVLFMKTELCSTTGKINLAQMLLIHVCVDYWHKATTHLPFLSIFVPVQFWLYDNHWHAGFILPIKYQ